MHNEWHKLHMPKPYESLPSMRTYIHNSWVWTGGEREEKRGLTKCLHGVICVHQGILLSYYWTLLYEELTVWHKEHTGICGEQCKMETLNNTRQKHHSSICYTYWGVTGVEVVCCDDEQDGWMNWTGINLYMWWWWRSVTRNYVHTHERIIIIIIIMSFLNQTLKRSQLHHTFRFKCSIILAL